MYCDEDPRVRKLAGQVGCKARSYGFADGADYQAREVVAKHPGNSFEVWSRGARLAGVTLNVPGQHNVLNALACFATLAELGVGADKIVAGSGELQRGGAALSAQRASATGSRWSTTTLTIRRSCSPRCGRPAKGSGRA